MPCCIKILVILKHNSIPTPYKAKGQVKDMKRMTGTGWKKKRMTKENKVCRNNSRLWLAVASAAGWSVQWGMSWTRVGHRNGIKLLSCFHHKLSWQLCWCPKTMRQLPNQSCGSGPLFLFKLTFNCSNKCVCLLLTTWATTLYTVILFVVFIVGLINN